MTPDLAFNTAVSFMTNTNWQSYGGETTMSYFVQMAALTVQNFVSAAAGIAVAIALIRGFARQRRRRSATSGWTSRAHGLRPAAALASSPRSSSCRRASSRTSSLHQVTTVEGATQTIAQGPVASQEAIKQLGTNGGGFFNANSAHPFENPTPLSNLLQMLLIFVIPARPDLHVRQDGRRHAAGLGDLRGDVRDVPHRRVRRVLAPSRRGNPIWRSWAIETARDRAQPGGNMEGKEVRFGIAQSALFATVTTDASCGAVNSMHDSFTPLGGLVPLFNMQTGEVIFGGVGAGLYGILLYAILAVFIAGLMVGRTPEYLGKKIEQKEVKMAMLALIATAFSILVFTAISSVLAVREGQLLELRRAGDRQPEQRRSARLAEILYAYTSGTANNGSAFAGITANTPWYNLTLGLAMLIGRFLFIIPLLAAAGSLAARRRFRTPAARCRRTAAVRRPARRHRGHRRRADVLPGARRSDRSSSTS